MRENDKGGKINVFEGVMMSLSSRLTWAAEPALLLGSHRLRPTALVQVQRRGWWDHAGDADGQAWGDGTGDAHGAAGVPWLGEGLSGSGLDG